MGGDRIPVPLDDQVDEETRRLKELEERFLGDEKNIKKMRYVFARARARAGHQGGEVTRGPLG